VCQGRKAGRIDVTSAPKADCLRDIMWDFRAGRGGLARGG